MQAESATLSNSGSVERWEQNTQKSGLDDANPNMKTELLPHEAEFLERIDKLQFYRGHQTSSKRSSQIPQLHCKEGCDSYEPSEFILISHS